MKNRVAILLPAYNSSSTIEATLKSVQEQPALSRLVFFCIADDASTDDTCEKAREAWKSLIELRIRKALENRGERANVNAAVELIAPEVDWFFVLHSDDLAKGNWLSMMLQQIEQCDETVASICSSWDNLLPDGRVVPGEDNPNRAVEIITGNPDSVRSTLLRGCWWHLSGCAIRVAAFKQIGGFTLNMPQLGDWDWLLRALIKGWSIEYIPRALIQYRQHSTSVSSISFQQHRDVHESLAIIRHFGAFLSKREIIWFHMRRLNYVGRRAIRAILRLDAVSTIGAVHGAFAVIRNMVRTLYADKHVSASQCTAP